MSKYFLLILITIGLLSCNGENAKTELKPESKPKTKTIPTSGQFIQDGLTFSYKYDEAKDATEINIKGESEEKYTYQGKVTKYFFSDLDADEKDEAFIVLSNKKESSQIKAFYISNGSPVEIYMNAVADAPTNSKRSFSAQYGQLIEKMEVKTPDNKTIKRDVRYNLVSGEAGYSLRPQGWTKEQLKSKAGQYKTGMYGKEKYYNKMYINESETGEWIVDIKVKDSKTERNVCEFQAIGEFINKDLFVPLNYADESLDGVLQIRFAGLTTIVYTQNTADGKQMATICKGKGNLSGNYTKLKVLYE